MAGQGKDKVYQIACNKLINVPPLQVVLIQVALPSSIEVKGHKKIEKEVNELVGRTNSEFASLDFMPVCYMNHAISLTELCALYSVADALLVTSLRGGLGSVVSAPFPFCYLH